MTTGSTTPMAPPVGAASHRTMDWRQINWSRVHRNVRRLQARIVQATQAGRWNKVKPCNACSPTRLAAKPLPCDE